MADRVRTHTRKTASGKTTTVRQHSRAGGPRRALLSPRHAWKLLLRAVRAARGKRRGLAVAFGILAAAELTAWLALEGAALVLATAGVLALGVAVAGAALGGVRR
jgi:hypothetical protein